MYYWFFYLLTQKIHHGQASMPMVMVTAVVLASRNSAFLFQDLFIMFFSVWNGFFFFLSVSSWLLRWLVFILHFLKDAFFNPVDYIRSLLHALKHCVHYHYNTIIMYLLLNDCWIACSISGLFSLSCSSVRVRAVSILITRVLPVLSIETQPEQVFFPCLRYI